MLKYSYEHEKMYQRGADVSDLREIVAKNICELRQGAGMTQLMLAEKLNYSDKAISKWERGESFPDIFMLKTIADLFGVSVDYLMAEDHVDSIKLDAVTSKIVRRNRILISFLATMLVWLIATVAFVTVRLVAPDSIFPEGMLFIYAAPISMLVTLIFNSIWGVHKLNYLIITFMSWTLLLSLHLTFLLVGDLNIWLIYIIGIPIQIIIFLWSGINNPNPKIKRRKGIKNETYDGTSARI